ncbi:MAG TPA: hypothetical protein VKE93_08870 [Candidatus Angelobacter sp.]|nr:hypothetical protein [Candidatus Angelobacter sp.]
MRLLTVLAFVVVLGASLARGQDGTEPFNKQGDQQNTQKATKNNDSQRKHWWSAPHWFHKKHDNTASTANSPFSKTGAGASARAKHQTVKTPDNKTVAAVNAPKTSSTSKTVTGARPTAVTRTGTAKNRATGNSRVKKTTTSAGKKTVRHGCTAEQSKKGGCEVDKGSSHKETAGTS